MRFGMIGSMVGLPMVAFELAKAKRGDLLPATAGAAVNMVSMPALTTAFASGLMLIPGIGPVAAGIVGAFAATYPNARFQNFAARGVRQMTQVAQNVRRLEMGGQYQDTLAAQSARIAAVQEMNASAVATRRFLGQEAVFYHR
jgi:hypothetical protein